MVYSNNFVATVKVGGKILRENKDVVALPFGSEYSIYLKNQNSVRALVRVSIDGQPLSDVADGWIIIGANQTLELERFIRNGNFSKGNRLKFIERTGSVEEHRGIGVDDGLVRVEYKFEKVVQYTQWLGGNYTIYNNGLNTLGGVSSYCYNTDASNVTYTSSGTVTTSTTPSSTTFNVDGATGAAETYDSYSGVLRSAKVQQSSAPTKGFTRSCATGQSRTLHAQAQMNCNMVREASVNETGVTVAGSESSQQFGWGSWFPTEDQSHVIVLKLVGKVGNNAPVAQPVTVQQKPVCTTCGKVGKASHKFCGRCGTALRLF